MQRSSTVNVISPSRYNDQLGQAALPSGSAQNLWKNGSSHIYAARKTRPSFEELEKSVWISWIFRALNSMRKSDQLEPNSQQPPQKFWRRKGLEIPLHVRMSLGGKTGSLGLWEKSMDSCVSTMEVKKQIQEIQILTRTSNLNLYFPVRQSPHRATPRLASLFFREEQGSHITGKTWNTQFFSWFLCAFSFL